MADVLNELLTDAQREHITGAEKTALRAMHKRSRVVGDRIDILAVEHDELAEEMTRIYDAVSERIPKPEPATE